MYLRNVRLWFGHKFTTRRYSRWRDYENNEVDYLIMSEKVKIKSSSLNNEHTSITLPQIKNKNNLSIVQNMKDTMNFKKFEFLGDAYVDFIVSVFLYDKYPSLTKRHLVDLACDITSNKNLGKMCLDHQLTQFDSAFPIGSKKYADIFEAYFGVVALESGICTHYKSFKDSLWDSWKLSTYFFEIACTENLKSYDLRENTRSRVISDTDRYIMQVKNNSRHDLESLFNADSNDFEKTIEIERLQFLGTSALRFLFTKVFINNMTTYDVKKIAQMRDNGLKEDVVTNQALKMLETPDFSQFYSLFNKKRKQDISFQFKSSYLKQYLGFLVSTYLPLSINKYNHRMFKIGWLECESLVNALYTSYMQKRKEKDIIKSKNTRLIDPTFLFSEKKLHRRKMKGK